MSRLDHEHEVILGVLASRGIATSADLQEATGKSQAKVSRLLADLSSRVLVLGRARATRYALPRPIRGLAAQQPIIWTEEGGNPHEIGLLSFLAGGFLNVESEYVQARSGTQLPWFLAPLKAQGFLGRLHAQRLPGGGVEGDPDRWDLETILYSALHLHDASGAITLGEVSIQDQGSSGPGTRPPLTPENLGAQLDALAVDVAKTLPAGSSAGGEQPKFLALMASGQHVIVKFTPPRGTPFGERWHDLLHAECLASQVLSEHGVDVANVQVVETSSRTFLVSDRFDRIGPKGRRHVVSIGDAHEAFVAGPRAHWGASADALARQGRLSPEDAARAHALRAFGHLIGNTDMHAGNLALLVSLGDLAGGRFTLAPVYDMLPMRWRPNASLGGAPDYGSFALDPLSLASASAGPALKFWQRLAEHSSVSRGLRATAGEMAKAIAREATPEALAAAQPIAGRG